MPCPVCGAAADSNCLSINVPVNCSALFSSREQAQAARKGTVALTFCRYCGIIFNAEFNRAIVEYDDSYENSLYFSPAFRTYCSALVRHLIDTYSLTNKTIVEIGCGDGKFLAELCEKGGNIGFGFDPAYKGNSPSPSVRMLSATYSSAHVDIQANAVCCRHVLEHIADPRDLLRAILSNLAKSPLPLFYCEVPNASAVFDGSSLWDVIYPHCCYFTAVSLRNLLERAGFRVLRIGASFETQFLGAEAAPLISGPVEKSPVTDELAGVAKMIKGFKHRFRDAAERWAALIESAQLQGRRVALWGVGAKAVTFLNTVTAAAGVGLLVDSNPRKHGMYVPGTGQRIGDPADLADYRPDALILLNPAYRSEICQVLQQAHLDTDLWVGMHGLPCIFNQSENIPKSYYNENRLRQPAD